MGVRSMTSAVSKTEDNVAMSSQSHLRKFNYVGLIALVLLMGSMAGSAFAAVADITVTTNRLAVTAGQATEDAVTITLSGAAGDLTAAGTIKITPPTGWTTVQNGVPANAGYVSLDTGTLSVTTEATPRVQISAVVSTTTSVTMTYNKATASTTTGKAYFTVEYNTGAGDTVLFNDSTQKSNNWVIVSADGSGSVYKVVPVAAADQPKTPTATAADINAYGADAAGTLISATALVAGTASQAIQFTYFAAGTGVGIPADIMNNGVLEIVFPSDMEAPNPGVNLVVNTETTDSGMGTVKATTEWTVSGSTVGIKISDMDGTDRLEVVYTPSILPVVTATARKSFTFRVSDSDGGTALDIASGSILHINIVPAAAGSGKVTFSGLQAVPASSSGHEISTTYTAQGTMDGGKLELIPPTGWTAPQGVPGVAGYTLIEVPAGKSYNDIITAVNFDASTDDGFSGNGIGIVIRQLRLDESFTIVYGKSGGTSGAQAGAYGPNQDFTFHAVPNEGDVTTINTSTDAIDLYPQGYVNVSTADGGLDTDGNTAATLVGLVTTPTTVTAGLSTTITFSYKTAGPVYNGGMFSVALPGNWTAPQTADSAAAGYTAIDAANSSGTFDTPYTRGREFRVPIRSMTSAGKTLTR